MGLTDMLSSAVRGHTGLHYVPSFNDFVSGAADDVEAMELQRDQQTRMTPLTSDAPKPVSNKTDDLPAMTSTIGDIHKVNRPILSGRADWIMDNARGGRHAPSVWQYILSSQNKEKLPRFDDIKHPQRDTIGVEELQKHFNVTPTQADAMVQEADRDNDSRISRQEYIDITMASA
ncbi:hypothetical protein VOLCADRAFT_86192 [Volvox carteri f. nagariensis]|uniref:EF-hand domain-containing protein n=1 Tax=Volvox carteri f. nagariensis TaxID=3068 RepID=D8TI47_VOLCA|nr:uncharacterized protein VOLCADRAFT_86192 [Volvox carteri f. nagariensis]EFJ52830.1 hypothetical protein VOLCADRAFT_86192 [Volvox carteri f. nagariensis]|eukprot:XP_002945835.1 hypothetical protein VOLCADRAFT_86192 [Volvox carteri f. nagariensis]